MAPGAEIARFRGAGAWTTPGAETGDFAHSDEHPLAHTRLCRLVTVSVLRVLRYKINILLTLGGGGNQLASPPSR